MPLLLHGRHGGPTVAYQPLGDWLVPWRFTSVEEEYQTLQTDAGLLDLSTLALIECRGPDRVDFLQRILTNDLKGLAPGSGCRAALLTPQAKLLADLLVLADPDAVWLLCHLSRADTVARTLDTYHFSEELTLTNHERRDAALALLGPRALEMASRLLDRALALPRPSDHALLEWEGMRLRVIRQHLLTGGLPGVICLVPAERAPAFWDALLRAGRACGVRPVGWEALNIARIEAGVPWFGLDMDETTLLPETGLEAIVASDAKGCYVGQEIVARLATYGSVSKKLMGLLMEGEDAPASGETIWREGEEVGRMTSACRSLALKRPIGMGYIKRGAYEAGTAVHIAHGTSRLSATVFALKVSDTFQSGKGV